MHLLKGITSFIKSAFINVFKILRSPREGIKSLYGISLYRNAVYLIENSVVLGLTGFFFWMIAARLYSTEAVGLASAAVAAMSLLAILSTLGLDFALIRFLPGAGGKARDVMNTCFTLGGSVSIVLALVFLAGLGFWSPALLLIREHPIFLIVFVVSVAATTLTLLIQQTFIAKRRAGFALAVRGLLFGLLRFIPLVIMAAFFQTFGIFTSWGITLALAVAIGILFLLPRVERGYCPLPVVRKEIINYMLHFSSTNYIANLSWFAPQFILPLIVVNLLDAEQNAYFYIAWGIGNILFTISIATSFSLFAEGSHHEERLKHEVTRSLKLVMVILVPAVLVLLLAGDKLLLLFGASYSQNATRLLQILAISALPLSINYIYFSIKRVKMQMKSVVWLSLFIAIVTLGLSCVLLPRIGIIGVGIAYLLAQGIVGLSVVRKLWKEKQVQHNPE